MKFKHLEVWRVQFGDVKRSHESILIAVDHSGLLPAAIEERQKNLIDINSCIDGSIVVVKDLSMTPTYYYKE